MGGMRTPSGLALAALVLAGCGGQESAADRAAARQAARADSVAMAEARYDVSAFDTLTWESTEARLERGGLVWRTSCVKCHGADGTGDGDMAERLGISVPSFLAADWPYAGQPDSIRHRIYVGHTGEMPNWGLHGLRYRDVDAAAAYIDRRVVGGGDAN